MNDGNEKSVPEYKSPAEVRSKVIEIVGLLTGYPMSQAVNILKQEAVILLLSSHTVDSGNPVFKEYAEHAARNLAAFESEQLHSIHSCQSDSSPTPCPASPEESQGSSPQPQGQSPTVL